MAEKRWFRILFPISCIALSFFGICCGANYEVDKVTPPLIVSKPKGCVEPTAFYVEPEDRASGESRLQVQCREPSGRITVYFRRAKDPVWQTITLRPDAE